MLFADVREKVRMLVARRLTIMDKIQFFFFGKMKSFRRVQQYLLKMKLLLPKTKKNFKKMCIVNEARKKLLKENNNNNKNSNEGKQGA
jgi:hypothetical protein